MCSQHVWWQLELEGQCEIQTWVKQPAQGLIPFELSHLKTPLVGWIKLSVPENHSVLSVQQVWKKLNCLIIWKRIKTSTDITHCNSSQISYVHMYTCGHCTGGLHHHILITYLLTIHLKLFMKYTSAILLVLIT